MRHIAAFSTLCGIFMAGCAQHPMANNRDYQECEYEAEKATPTSNSIMADAFRKHDLISMCMRNKGYR